MQMELDSHDYLDERQFSIAVRRLADSLSYGTDGSPFLGSGIEYVLSRPYVARDSVKSIDWRVTARSGKVHVKEYEAPKRMSVYLLVDTSASMCVTSQRLSKYAWAVQIAGGLALSALTRVSPVGVIGCGESDLKVRPSLSRVQVFQWLHKLRRYQLNESTTLGRRLHELGAIADSRSVIFVLSDLHDPTALAPLKMLAQEHDCIVLQFKDPAEGGRTGGGIFRAEEAETGEAFVGHGRSRWFAEDATERELKRSGIDHLVLTTDKPFLPVLRGFLKKRDSLGRGTR